jgi:hypothetical protein
VQHVKSGEIRVAHNCTGAEFYTDLWRKSVRLNTAEEYR